MIKKSLFVSFLVVLAVAAPILSRGGAVAEAGSAFNTLRIVPGDAAPPPDFTFPDLEGKPHRLRDLKGKVVILAFFATWCPLCNEEMPRLKAIHEKYKDRGLTVLAVSIDRAGAGLVRAWVKEKKLTYPVLHDQRYASRRSHNVRFVPTVYLLDRQQKLAAWVIGAADWDRGKGASLIERLLKAPEREKSSAVPKKTTQRP
ncbi:MAG: TlpA disulfide reductase family protein [bacterium]|nr:TlpA disulfide reductase family protein [bacterium]